MAEVMLSSQSCVCSSELSPRRSLASCFCKLFESIGQILWIWVLRLVFLCLELSGREMRHVEM